MVRFYPYNRPPPPARDTLRGHDLRSAGARMVAVIDDRGIPGPMPRSVLIPRGALLVHPDTIHLLGCGDDETVLAILIDMAVASAETSEPSLYNYEAPCRCGQVVEA